MKKRFSIFSIPLVCLLLAVSYFYQSNASDHKAEKQSTEPHTEDKHDDEHEHEGEHDEESKELDHDESQEDHDHKKGDKHGEDKEHGHHDDHGEEETSASVGPDSAILEAHETRGIRLSPEAIKRLQLSTEILSTTSQNIFQIKKTAYIGERGKSFMYVVRDSWYQLVPVVLISKTKDSIIIQSSNLKQGEFYVTNGASLVRLAHLEAFGASGDGHGH